MKSKLKKYNIGLLSAMPEELGLTLSKLENLSKILYGTLEIFSGDLTFLKSKNIEIKIFAAWSGWGKVNATYAATRLISEADKQNLNLDFILFTGVAGAACSSLNQWDIVVAKSFIQHDMDARPLFEQYVIPGLKIASIKMNISLSRLGLGILKERFSSNSQFGEIHSGLIATGDKFVDDKMEMQKICKNFPELKAVEMEGGAVSQVAFFGINTFISNKSYI